MTHDGLVDQNSLNSEQADNSWSCRHYSAQIFMDASEKPSPAAAESSSQQEDSQWLAALSKVELDLLISLKELATMRAKNAGHPRLADKFDLRTVRALGIVLLESFKERLKETSVDTNIFDRLALLSDSDVGFTNSGSDSEMVGHEDQQTPIGVKRK